ncbi:Stp1/IreP family PP2C-type Ser/Thr phosphatase [Streptomyces litchfieldiae]|uniref:Stp1/IreP family PP2C-type Ser/Thr phosphatase n=1 Tax=Streptomyces litchfieldiae TaxID=3075543 RepID=A0ABU2ML05_9ACTN|nr:Stp1/IreP family PP2C-type Ser/Thr phosphatase [Streptomyces sp. DSM 44938]MDT0342117.1 Stp1/IreP family PP2C-type Ser/Thr phosphatase [Streptomyces sp. DSM 44938]
MSLSLRFAAGSHTGMIRDHNEDSGYAGPRLLAIADGMGGQAAGEVASSEVISTLVQLDDDIPGSDVLTSLDASVQRANEQLRAMVTEDPRLDGMGTTLTALLWTGQRLGLVHVGDSRAYLLRDGELSQITQDHTWVQRLVDEGRITEEEATTHPQRSLLMRALGSSDHIDADLSIREVRPGDRYLLCSDGLSGVVSQDTLRDTLNAFAPPQDTVRELIELALRGGGPDNITCIVADVLDMDTQESDTLARQLYDAPQIVGAVAETQNQRFGENNQTPASRAAELARPPMPPGAPAPGLVGPPTGVFGSFADDDYVSQRPRGKAWKRTVLIVLALAIVGGGLYAGYRWTQTQYYIAANGDHVALYQGISQDLGPLSLSSVERDFEDIKLDDLPTFQQDQVTDSISAGSRAEAEDQIDELAAQAEACRLLREQDQQREQAEQEQQQEQDNEKGTANGGAGEETPEDSGDNPETPSLSEEQQRLARQCGT